MTIPKLLVSVRDAAEAEAALAGGADLIDVKEPANGPLGRADFATIAEVVKTVAGRVPISAALGELRDCPLVRVGIELPEGVEYVKWGLAGLLRQKWAHHFQVAHLFLWAGRRVVAVAYADWVPAESPRPADVVAYARDHNIGAILLDTYQKGGTTLLDWLSVAEIAALVETCRESGVPVALAGSLGVAEIERLLPLAPDWFAVRGAACAGGRGGRVEESRVRALAELIRKG
jgi:uncharacterized protein (UPF0264 family)